LIRAHPVPKYELGFQQTVEEVTFDRGVAIVQQPLVQRETVVVQQPLLQRETVVVQQPNIRLSWQTGVEFGVGEQVEIFENGQWIVGTIVACNDMQIIVQTATGVQIVVNTIEFRTRMRPITTVRTIGQTRSVMVGGGQNLFSALDQNKDGVITRSELSAGLGGGVVQPGVVGGVVVQQAGVVGGSVVQSVVGGSRTITTGVAQPMVQSFVGGPAISTGVTRSVVSQPPFRVM